MSFPFARCSSLIIHSSSYNSSVSCSSSSSMRPSKSLFPLESELDSCEVAHFDVTAKSSSLLPTPPESPFSCFWVVLGSLSSLAEFVCFACEGEWSLKRLCSLTPPTPAHFYLSSGSPSRSPVCSSNTSSSNDSWFS